MNETEQDSKAEIKPLKTISRIWLIPLVAVFIGVWMIFIQINSKGPVISISFETAEGIEIGKTKIKIKNVDVGLVENIELNDDMESVTVSARINKSAQKLLRAGTEFWVVRPRIGKAGISGLSTLLSGAYIELSPGKSEDEADEFVGLENEPVTPAGTEGLHITLESGAFRALNIGDQVLFHGIEVGRIEFVYFNTDERRVYYDAFIESPHDKLITTNTKFWEVSGFEVSLSADGIDVQTGTLETLISGGVTFDVPNNMPKGEVVDERAEFTVFPNKNSIYENQYKNSVQYILLFKDSIRGLIPGAPVEYRGVKIGNVTRTDIKYDEITNVLDKNTMIPVMIALEPGRMGFDDTSENLETVKQEVKQLIKNGLRGGLVSGNLLTGSKYVELQYEEGVQGELSKFSDYIVIPTLQSQFDQILKKFGRVMDKLYDLPLEPVVKSTDVTLNQLTKTLKEYSQTAKELNILLKQSSDQSLVKSIQDALSSFEKLANDFSEGSATNEEIQNILRVMRKTLEDLEPLLTQLNQKPNSLIFSNQKNEDIIPQGKK